MSEEKERYPSGDRGTQLLMAPEDAEKDSYPYREEQILLESVRRGEVEDVRRISDGDFPRYLRMIRDSERKTEEYISVAALTLVSRAAVEGGVSSAESFALADVYLGRIAQAKDKEELLEIRGSIAIAFTELVAGRRSRKKSGSYIEECKSYIAANIFRKLSVGDVAKELSLSPIYLERIFKESEGITISRYIQKEKIGRAKNLLVYSDRSILEISGYLGFNSQSHFGKVFREETGMTPKQYRMVHHMNGF